MRVKEGEFPARGEVDKPCPGGGARKSCTPIEAGGHVGRVAQPEAALVHEPKRGLFDEDRRHFERGAASATARDAVKLVVRQVFADEFSLQGVFAAFLQPEQVGIMGADALEDEEFAVFPAVDAVVRQPVADVEGHEGEH